MTVVLKLWHDDVRRPPEGDWLWVRTNEEARRALAYAALVDQPFVEASLDHDLGLHDYDPDVPDADLQRLPDGARPEEGWELVEWMIDCDVVPEKVTIHSWNPNGADRMAALLRDAGHSPIIQPYERPRR